MENPYRGVLYEGLFAAVPAIHAPFARFSEAMAKAAILLGFGLFEEAEAVAAAAPGAPRRMDRVRFQDACRRLSAGRRYSAPLQDAPQDPVSEYDSLTPERRAKLWPAVAVAPHPGADSAVLVLGGAGPAYWLMDHLLSLTPRPAIAGAHHAIFVRDPRQLFHMAGLAGFSADYDETTRRLRQVLDGLGVRRLFCVGTSSGGYAALRLGLDLGAEGVLSLSGPTTIDAAASPDPDRIIRLNPWMVPLRRLAGHQMRDCVPLYLASPRRPRVVLVYGGAHARDAMLNERMGHVPGVTLAPVQGLRKHGTYGELRRLGRIPDLLNQLLALRAWDARIAADQAVPAAG